MADQFGIHMLLAAEGGADLPSVKDFLPDPVIFAGTPFAINRIILIRIVAALILLTVLGLTAARAKVIPGRWQSFIEMAIDFVKDNVVFGVLGEQRGKRYVPMIVTMFFSIFVFNVCSIIPGANIAATATIMMPLIYAIWTFIQYWIAAARGKGLLTFLKEDIFIPGAPLYMYPLLAPIQVLELLVIRPASLTIRLFANMVSGHLMVAAFVAFTQFWLVDSFGKTIAALPIGGIWFVGAIIMTCFEAFVAFLQAYVFAILATVYISQSYPED